MRVVIDAMGAPGGRGGMNLYARELVTAWSEQFARDELIVVGGTWTADAFAGRLNVTTRVVKGHNAATRMWTQFVTSGVRFRTARADALLSLSAIASPFVPSRRRAVTVHDWRHRTRPEEFGPAQRAYRRLWVSSIRTAGTTIAISGKTARETTRFARTRRLVVVENGGDHPRRWAAERYEKAEPIVLTYGHLPNKRPEQVIDAIALLSGTEPRLVVLGAVGDHRDSLHALAVARGIAHRVDLPGFVPESDYRRMLASADVVVLNSSDEGFGMPVVEAEYFGIPVVVADDSGLASIHRDRVIVAEPTAPSLARAIDGALAIGARAFPPRPTWAQSAAAIRETLLAAVPERAKSPRGTPAPQPFLPSTGARP